jgi:hypothetical protein
MTTLETQDLERMPDYSLPHGIQIYVEPLDMYCLLDFLSITQLEMIINKMVLLESYCTTARSTANLTGVSRREMTCAQNKDTSSMYSVSAPLYFTFSEIKNAVFSILERF